MADPVGTMLAQCRAVLFARRSQAEAAHGMALREAAVAEQARTDRETALATADRAWRAQLQQGFDPDLGRLLAGTLLAAAATATEAERDAMAARERCATTVQDWHAADGRCRALDRQAKDARRREERRRDAARLAAQADRLCFEWGRR